MGDKKLDNPMDVDVDYRSGSECTPYDSVETQPKDRSDEDEPYFDGLSDFEQFGTTPPRTRILRRSKEWKQRNRESSLCKNLSKLCTAKMNRRNTVSDMYFNELLAKAESNENGEGKKMDKRSMKLLRESERDNKLDIPKLSPASSFENDERCVSMPEPLTQPIQVETSRRFMCLKSKPVACQAKKRGTPDCEKPAGCPQNRIDFYQTFSMLIRMGCPERQLQDRNCRRNISREEQLWQNELKDLLWLELQAWHAGRTPTEQDQFLCRARESVGVLLDQIMNYTFTRLSRRSNSRTSISSVDSGVGTERLNSCPDSAPSEPVSMDCSGCLSMYCDSCNAAQSVALQEVESLLCRLDSAQSLYPSSKAFALQYPLYKSEEFMGRVKAMCLWYNMTKYHRLKVLILGKLLAYLHGKPSLWPMLSQSPSSGYGSDDVKSSYGTDDGSPQDSNNSNSSTCSGGTVPSPEELSDVEGFDYSGITPKVLLGERYISKSSYVPYKKYVEGVLKTKGLSKSMRFLERLYHSVLRKARITLENPAERIVLEDDEDIKEEAEELRRYGSWSVEAQSLGLPSYRPAFLFLSMIPLEVVHAFLKLRLEQKPAKPSPLSVRQLMREIKEGLTIAVSHRERATIHFKSITLTDSCLEQFHQRIEFFNKTVLDVLEMYLEYLEHWALLHHENFQKSLLEQEWSFLKEICPKIPNSWVPTGERLFRILSTMVQEVEDRLVSGVQELLSDLHEDSVKKQSLFAVCRELQKLLTEERERGIKLIAFTKTVQKESLQMNIPEINEMSPLMSKKMKHSLLGLKYAVIKVIELIQTACCVQNLDDLDETERTLLQTRCREILHQGYRFGFEFHKEMSRVADDYRDRLARSMVKFASLWMQFVQERCERGRGVRPRWASQGLDFLMAVCEPQNTIHLTDEEFEDLKTRMDACISHVIGTATPTTPEGFQPNSPRLSLEYGKGFPRSRGASPSPRPYRSGSGVRKDNEKSPGADVVDASDKLTHSLERCWIRNSGNENQKTADTPPAEKKKKISIDERCFAGILFCDKDEVVTPWGRKVGDAIQKLENNLDERLRFQDLIGTITETKPEDKVHIKYRRVNFSWQRGIKIGQGRFGKVYTAVNNKTGEMLAMKEIALQPNDHRPVRRIVEELRILEGINHPNLVRYYGIEIHKEEMLIFMEFCEEGSLESLVASTENGLPELLVRRFTFQLLSGVAELHAHGIVHRDIKSANIFLTDGGNCLKIGDFGSAVKIKAHTTLPGELQGFVGTQAYMAPEVFMKTNMEGHGRAADIWSVGCVVVEMTSGKRPWAEFDSNYQVMFKVGMGERPEVPDFASDEAHHFVDLCLQHNPRDRPTASELLGHDFVKIEEV